MITSVKQEYRSTESRQDYRIELEIIYRRRETFMDIGKSKDNYDKNRKLLWQPLITKTNSSMTSKSLSRISSRDHKITSFQYVATLFIQ